MGGPSFNLRGGFHSRKYGNSKLKDLLTRCPDKMTSTFCQAGSCDCWLMMKYWRILCSRSMNLVPHPMESTLNEHFNIFSRSLAAFYKFIIKYYTCSACIYLVQYSTSANLNQKCAGRGLNENLPMHSKVIP